MRIHVAAALLLVLALPVLAGPRRIRITKKDGSVVEGVLEDRKERTYKLTADGKTVSIPEDDVLRVDFLEEEEAKPPRNPWAAAKEGDWACYVVTSRDAAGSVIDSGVAVRRVTAVDGDEVTVEEKSVGRDYARTFHEMKSKGFLDGTDRKRVTLARDRRTIGGRSFECTKVAIEGEANPGHFRREALWLDESLGNAIVEWDEVSEKGSVIQELAGYGNGPRTFWGKTADELTGPVKVRPWQHVKTGDWWSYVVVAGGKSVFKTWSAQEADGQLLSLELFKSGKANRGDDPATWLRSWFFARDPKDMVQNEHVEDDTRTIEGRTFACQKLSVELVEGTRVTKFVVWFAKDGEPPIVAMSVQGPGETADVEVRGFGNTLRKTWGKTQDELAAPPPGKLEPWKNVKPGDWWSFSVVEDGKSSFETWSADRGKKLDLDLRLWLGKVFYADREQDGLEWLGLIGGVAVDPAAVESDERTIDGRIFPCTKVTLVPSESKKLVVWFGKDDAPPIVAVRSRGWTPSLDAEIRGYGDSKATVWGKTKEELEK
jgi:hypothetical protein